MIHCIPPAFSERSHCRYTARMNSPQSNPLLAILGRALQEFVNRALALDPAAAARLRALEGRSIDLTWSAAQIGMRLRAENGLLTVGPRADAPDLSMSGTLAGFAKLLLPQRAGALPAGRVQMSGDAELARQLAQLAEQFKPDFDAAFGRAFGPTHGAMLAVTLRDALHWGRGAASSLAEDAADFLREESHDTPPRAEVDDFNAAVDRVRDDAERIAARVALLAAKLGTRQ